MIFFVIQEDTYVEFMKIRKVPIERTEREGTIEDVIPMVSILKHLCGSSMKKLGRKCLLESGVR
jgi:hypothetical protein